MGVLIGIDIGGTFTDLVALDTQSGILKVTKVPSTPGEFSDGFFAGVEKIRHICDTPPEAVTRLVHGTTVATNAILEQKGSKIGILTTKGFRDILIMGKGIRSQLYNVLFDSETPTFLCPRERILEITERVNAAGEIVEALDEEEVLAAADELVLRHGVESIAVCYLFSFFNRDHEERTVELIRERYPNVRVSVSSQVNPRFREYERLVVTAFDAYIGPVMEAYIHKLSSGLDRRGMRNLTLQVMQSRGGITSGTMCARRPVLTLLSGPAAGVISAKMVARQTGRDNVLTLDLGGTSNDVALIQNGETALSTEGKIGSYPCRQAMMDISTIGTGGGSIAWVDAGGWLRVGPRSAGSRPGPACYGKGGEEPTYTDASLLLGYLRPDYFAGGEIQLRPELAEAAIREKIAEPLGMDVYQAATAIHRIMHNKMADQLRLVTVQRGYDPRKFSVVAFGGAGPIAAARLLDLVGFREVIVAPTPGVMSALGLLAADIEHEEVVTFPAAADTVDPAALEAAIRQGEVLCEAKRQEVGIGREAAAVSYSAEMRYVGQSYELEVPIPEAGGEITRESVRAMVDRFHETHHRIYRHSHPGLPVEFSALRVLFSQPSHPAPAMEKWPAGAPAQPAAHRHTYFEERGGWVDTPVYRRVDTVAGQVIPGPAILEQEDSTILVGPGQRASVDQWGNLIITKA